MMGRAVVGALVMLAGCDGGNSVEARDATPAEVAAKMERQGVQQVKMQPGEWATTVKVTEIDMPGVDPRMTAAMQSAKSTTTVNNCLTEADVAKPDARLIGQASKDCKFDRFKMDGGRLSYVMNCAPPGAGTMTASVDGTISATAYDLTMKSEMKAPGMPGDGTMTSTATVSGKRIGACKA